MKRNRNGGYSLIEILLAIVLLGAIMVPTCTSLVRSVKINDRTDEMMQAQLAVSSAVETLMAEGIVAEQIIEVEEDGDENYGWIIVEETDADGDKTTKNVDRFPEVEIVTQKVTDAPYYAVTVTKTITMEDETTRELASVTTYIRAGGGGE